MNWAYFKTPTGLWSLALALPLVWLSSLALDWALISAVFKPDLAACALAAGEGACWGVVAQKWQVILFGRFPEAEIWRPMVFTVAWTTLLFATIRGMFSFRYMASMWAISIPAGLLLMHGGPLGLPVVETSLWGGLALTLLIAILGMGLAFPLAVLLALGRSSKRLWLSVVSSVYIELFRALPLISVLFLAAFVLPLFLPGGGGDLLPRVVVTIALFAAAYLAEVIRGGLQSVLAGQSDAAYALGLNYWQVQGWVILPQAIRACLPSLVNSFVTLFKECSLVSIVSLFELTGALSLALSGDVQWRQYYLEGALFIALLYYFYCSALGRIGESKPFRSKRKLAKTA